MRLTPILPQVSPLKSLPGVSGAPTSGGRGPASSPPHQPQRGASGPTWPVVLGHGVLPVGLEALCPQPGPTTLLPTVGDGGYCTSPQCCPFLQAPCLLWTGRAGTGRGAFPGKQLEAEAGSHRAQAAHPAEGHGHHTADPSLSARGRLLRLPGQGLVLTPGSWPQQASSARLAFAGRVLGGHQELQGLMPRVPPSYPPTPGTQEPPTSHGHVSTSPPGTPAPQQRLCGPHTSSHPGVCVPQGGWGQTPSRGCLKARREGMEPGPTQRRGPEWMQTLPLWLSPGAPSPGCGVGSVVVSQGQEGAQRAALRCPGCGLGSCARRVASERSLRARGQSLLGSCPRDGFGGSSNVYWKEPTHWKRP